MEGVSGTDSGTRTVFHHNNCTDFKDITWKGCRARTRELEQSFITTTVPTSKILRGRGVGHGLGNSNSLSSQQLYRLPRYYLEGVSGTDSGTRTVFDHNNCTDGLSSDPPRCHPAIKILCDFHQPTPPRYHPVSKYYVISPTYSTTLSPSYQNTM